MAGRYISGNPRVPLEYAKERQEACGWAMLHGDASMDSRQDDGKRKALAEA